MSQKSRPPQAELQIRPVASGGWTWCYVEAEDDVELFSNETYRTPEAAREWGRRAYPDLPIAEHPIADDPIADNRADRQGH